MGKNIFSITGYSCTGKSTLVEQLVNNLNIPILKYRDVHWEAIKNSGYKLGIDWIKAKGFEEYEDGALKVFTEKLSKYNVNEIIIDGIFSYKCFKYLKDNTDINLVNILLETSFDKRLIRMIEREGYSLNVVKERLENADWLKYHAGLSRIVKEADYVINGENSKKVLLGQVLKIICKTCAWEERGGK